LTKGKDARNQEAVIAYSALQKKDWMLTFVQPLSEKQGPLRTFQKMMIAVLLISFAGVFVLALWITRNFVGRLQTAEQEHDALLHRIEHTNKLASIGRLAAGVAHEINNPVAIINEKAGLMKDLTEMSDDFANKERFLDLLRSIHSSVVRCRAVTHRLLGFARQMDVAPEVIDLNDLIREVLGFLEREAFHREIQVDLDLPEDLPSIKSDRGQLQQVFLNLVNNAMDAVENEGKISITSWAADEEVVGVKISDDGCGIPPDTLKQIFEPFFTTKSRGKGTGLGLSITYGIITKLGGKVSVESEVDKGTTFTIELPKDYKP
jgi:two-component system NtrC family sensor kinase